MTECLFFLKTCSKQEEKTLKHFKILDMRRFCRSKSQAEENASRPIIAPPLTISVCSYGIRRLKPELLSSVSTKPTRQRPSPGPVSCWETSVARRPLWDGMVSEWTVTQWSAGDLLARAGRNPRVERLALSVCRECGRRTSQRECGCSRVGVCPRRFNDEQYSSTNFFGSAGSWH